MIILIFMNWWLYIAVFSWACYFQPLHNICIYTAQTKMTWKLPLKYILYIYTYIVLCITLNKLYLVGCIRGLYCKWIMKQQWFHLSIRASPAYIWCMSCNTALETHFMPTNDIRAQYVCLNTDPGIDTGGMYLCFGNGKWEKSLFGN